MKKIVILLSLFIASSANAGPFDFLFGSKNTQKIDPYVVNSAGSLPMCSSVCQEQMAGPQGPMGPAGPMGPPGMPGVEASRVPVDSVPSSLALPSIAYSYPGIMNLSCYNIPHTGGGAVPVSGGSTARPHLLPPGTDILYRSSLYYDVCVVQEGFRLPSCEDGFVLALPKYARSDNMIFYTATNNFYIGRLIYPGNSTADIPAGLTPVVHRANAVQVCARPSAEPSIP